MLTILNFRLIGLIMSAFTIVLIKMSDYDEFHSVANIPQIEEPVSENVTYLNICVVFESDSYFMPSYNKVAAAVDLGIKNANSFILPRHLQLQTVFQTAGESCSQLQHSVVTNVLRLLKKGVSCDAFLGPGCATTGVAMYGIAEQLNIPIFGCPAAGASSLSLNNSRTRYPLLLRIPFGFADAARSLITFWESNNYTHITILRDDSFSFFSFMSKYIMYFLQSNYRYIFRTSIEVPFSGLDVSKERLRSLLENAGNRSRVVLILTHAVVVRKIMLTANGMGMTGGDYVFIAVQLYDLAYWGRIRSSEGDKNDGEVRKAYQSLLLLTLADSSITDNSFDDTLSATIKILSKERYNFTYQPLEKPDPVIMGFYESILIYAQEVNTMRRAGLDFRNGTAMTRRIILTEYRGISGSSLTIASNAERVRDFDLKMFDTKQDQFKGMFRFAPTLNITMLPISEDDTPWFAGDGVFPPDKPLCGYRSDECKTDQAMSPGITAVVVVIPLLAVLSMLSGVIFAIIKLRKLRMDYDPNWWKALPEDITIKQNRTGSGTMSKKTLNSQSTAGLSGMSGISGYNVDIVASYRGALVALTDVGSREKMPTPEMISRLSVLKNVTHPNLQRFIGIGLAQNGKCQYVIAELCPKGSLTDILGFSTIKLDWSFKNSLIKDLVFGLTCIHTSPIVSHGNVTAHTCLIDTRFTVKISDVGLPFFRDPAFLRPYRAQEAGGHHQDSHQSRNFELLLWRAPELLRQTMPPDGTQKGDVYSFAVLLQQIILRSGPFELPNDPLEMSEQEILQEVVGSNIPPVRPRVPRAACSNELYGLMESCWEEVPIERPTFPKIKERLKRVIGDHGDNIVDVLFKRMEQYAVDLEIKVAEKTQQFMDEKNRSEQLLSQLLPKPVAEALTRGVQVDPEAFQSVTIFFSDIVGFTTLAAKGSPMDVIDLLNALYTFFDATLEKYDVYKVETIGDAYMVSSGLPVRNGNKHASEIATMALDLREGITKFIVPHRPTEVIQIRIGINSGPCVAGIVGLKMPRYCLFGDTVNVASRMESTGEPMKIQISFETRDLLNNIGGFITIERGPVMIKGKGNLITFFLISKQ